MNPDDSLVRRLVRLAREEDLPQGDITTELIGGLEKEVEARILAKEELVWCEGGLTQIITEEFEENLLVKEKVDDGKKLKAGEVALVLSGELGSLLRIERTLLNFVQHLSGISTHVKSLAEAFPELTLLDTRKTLPGYRYLEKYAVKIGGGKNHRMSLSDQVLIKDNHISGSGKTPSLLVAQAHAGKPEGVAVEVEIDSFEGLEKVLPVEPDIILLDNMDDELLRKCVAYIESQGSKAVIEVSGNINRKRLEALKDLTQCCFSMGSLTYGAKHVDLSMKIIE